MRTKIFMLIAGLLILNIGCTRAAKDVAKLNLSIASSVDGNGTLSSTMQLAHVSINVTGTGIAAPIIQTWDACRGCTVQNPTPSSFALTVPSGAGRLIQILAVYEDSETSQMAFYYGDVTKDLNLAEDTAAITVDQVGQGVVTSGRVAGRYFTTTTTGPTGLVDIKYNPGNGKPSLIVDNGVIVNGWFSLFMLSGANLQYVVRDTKEVLWGQEVSFDSAPMDPAENSGAYFNQRVRAFIPVHIEQRSESGGVTTYRKQDAETHVWGYWGPGAVGKRVCTSGLDNSPTPSRIKMYTSGTPESASGFSVGHYINWNIAPPTKAQLTDIVSPYGYVIFQGGVSMSSNCDSIPDTFANQFTNFQKVTLNLVDGNGGDSVAGFMGIFRGNSNNGFATISSADPKVISGSILPGVDEVFNGVRLFKRVNNDEFRLEIPRCHELASHGFEPASSTDAVLDSSGLFSLTSNITAAEGTSGVSAVLCPVKAGVMAPIGIFLGKWNFSMGGGGGMGGSPATKLVLVAPQETTTSGTMVNNLCTPMTIEARTASDTIGQLPGMMNINLGSSDGNTSFHAYSSCSGAITSIQTGSSYNTVYVKRTGSGNASSTLSVSGASLSSGNSNMSFVDAPGTLTPKIVVNFPTTIAAHECYPISFESWHSNQYMASFYDAYAQSFTLNLALGTGIGYYYMGDCTSGSYTTANLGSYPVSSMYFKYTGAATTLNLQPTSISPASPILTSDIVGGNNITVIQPGAPTTFDFMVPTTFQEGQCMPIMIRSTDSNGRTSPTTAAVSLDLATTISGGAFHQNVSCTTPITSFSYPVSTTTQVIYFKSTATGSGTMTASSTSPTLSVTRNTTITPATYSQMFIALPGESYASGALVGTPQIVPQGMNRPVTIYLVKYDGQVDTNANGMLLTGGSMSGGTMDSPPSISFTNGVATANFMANNSYNDVTISLSSGTIYGNSSYAKTFNPATMLNIYMSNSNALAPGGCQLLAVIPESVDGASSVSAVTSFTISADNGGGIYSDASCSVAANGTYTFSPGDRIAPFFFKQPSNSTSSAITVTANNGLISTPLNVATNSTALGSAYAFMFTGRMTSMKAAVCQPYLVSVADNAGRSVVIGTDQPVTLQVNSGGGTVGTFDDQSCDWPYSGAPTSISASSNYAYVFLTAMISGSTHLLNASGSPLQTTTSSGIIPSP